MTDPVVLSVFWYPLVLVFAWLLHRQTRCFTSWNTLTVFGALLLVSHGVLTPFTLDANVETNGVWVAAATKVRYVLMLGLAFAALLLGVLAANRRNRFSVAEIRDQVRLPAMPGGVHGGRMFLVLSLLAAVGVYMESQITGGINLLDLITGNMDTSTYFYSRWEFGVSFFSGKGGILYLGNLMFISWFLAYIAMSYALWKGGTRWALLWFVFLSGLYLFHGIRSGQKNFVAVYLVTMMAAHAFGRGNRNFKRALPAVAGLGGFLLLFLLPLQFMAQYDYLDYPGAVWKSVRRLAVEPNRAMILYVDTYPERHPFIGLGSVNLAAKALGLDVTNPEEYIPTFEFGVYDTRWPVGFMGAAWAGWGWLGVAVQAFLVGYVLQRVNIWYERARPTALRVGLYIALIMASARFAVASATAVLMTYGFGVSFLLYLAVKKYGSNRSAAAATAPAAALASG